MLATMLTMKYFLLTRQRGIVMQLSVPVFAGPHEQYHTVGDMHKAEIFVVHDQRAAWYKISCKKCIGWVQADQVMII
jgi:hypothetical protein